MADTKPSAEVVGGDGNVFAVLGSASRALKLAGQHKKVAKMRDRVTKAGSYDEALQIMMEYVDFE